MGDECPERRFRTLFISDIHLGARGSQAERLLDFLRSHDADTIYLVGDIVDGWALRSSWYWPQSHNDLMQKMLRKACKGAKVVYVPGNHDEFLRSYYGTHFGGIDVVENAIHVGSDGRRYLVIHGDIFDLVVQNARWLAHLGDKAYLSRSSGVSGARKQSRALTQSAASCMSSSHRSAGTMAIKPLIGLITGIMFGIGRGVSANKAHATSSSVSVFPSASDNGAFSVA